MLGSTAASTDQVCSRTLSSHKPSQILSTVRDTGSSVEHSNQEKVWISRLLPNGLIYEWYWRNMLWKRYLRIICLQSLNQDIQGILKNMRSYLKFKADAMHQICLLSVTPLVTWVCFVFFPHIFSCWMNILYETILCFRFQCRPGWTSCSTSSFTEFVCGCFCFAVLAFMSNVLQTECLIVDIDCTVQWRLHWIFFCLFCAVLAISTKIRPILYQENCPQNVHVLFCFIMVK